MGSASNAPNTCTAQPWPATYSSRFQSRQCRSGQLVDAILVPPTLERRVEKGPEAVDRDGDADHPGAESQHVCVVVPSRHRGGGHVVAQCRPDMWMPVSGDADPDARPADEHAALCP